MTTRPTKRPGDTPETTDPPTQDDDAQERDDAPDAVRTAESTDAPADDQPAADAAAVSATPEQPAVAPDETPDNEVPQGLPPAWNPDDVSIEGRPSALEAAEEIARDLGHDTIETEEA